MWTKSNIELKCEYVFVHTTTYWNHLNRDQVNLALVWGLQTTDRHPMQHWTNCEKKKKKKIVRTTTDWDHLSSDQVNLAPTLEDFKRLIVNPSTICINSHATSPPPTSPATRPSSRGIVPKRRSGGTYKIYSVQRLDCLHTGLNKPCPSTHRMWSRSLRPINSSFSELPTGKHLPENHCSEWS